MADTQTPDDDETAPAEKTPEQIAAYWLANIASAEKKRKPFITRGRQIVRRFKNRRGDAVSPSLGTRNPGGRRMNVLWSNVQTQKPVLFAQTPKANVSRRNKTKDPVGRTASIVLQNVLQNSLAMEDFDFIMGQVVEDRLLPGSGVAMVEYVPQITDDVIGWQAAETAYVHWEDTITNTSRIWQEVWFWGYRTFQTKQQCYDIALAGTVSEEFPQGDVEFAEDVRTSITLDHRQEEEKDKGATQESEAKAVVWTIWDKNKKQVLHIATGYAKAPLATMPPPVTYDDFFPIPRPLQSTTANDSTIPVADFDQYVDQADEIDLMTQRIGILSKALKVRGLYPADMDALKQLMDAGDADMIPYDQWQLIEGAGGVEKLVLWLPLDMIINTLLHCVTVREQAIQVMYQITGISDIMRGASEAQETLGAQQLKAQFGGVRVRDSQKEVQRFVRDLMRKKAEVICEHFELEVIKEMAGVKLLTEAEKAQVLAIQQKQQLFAQQQQMIAQQAQAQAMPPPPPAQSGIPPIPDDILEALDEPTWEQVMGLLKNGKLRGFVIDVETDSTVEADQQAQQAAAVAFTSAVAQYLTAIFPIVQAQPKSIRVFGDMLLWVTRSWKAADTIENSLEEFVTQMEKDAEQPPPSNPQMEVEKMKGQAEVQKAGAQVKVAEIGVQKAQIDLAASAQDHQQAMTEMAMSAATMPAQPENGVQ